MMEEVCMLQAITEYSNLERNLISYYKEVNNSLLSWMLMLEDEEFNELREKVYNDLDNCGVLVLIICLEGKMIPGSEISDNSLNKGFGILRSDTALISLCKKGILEYRPDKEDDDWMFIATKPREQIMDLVRKELGK